MSLRDAEPPLARLMVKPVLVAVSVPAVWLMPAEPADMATVPPWTSPANVIEPAVAVRVLLLEPTNEPELVMEILLWSDCMDADAPLPVSTAETVMSVEPVALVASRARVPEEVMFWEIAMEAPVSDKPVSDVLVEFVVMAPALEMVRLEEARLLS